MTQNEGFDAPTILDNEVNTIQRVSSELTDNLTVLLNRIIDLENRVKELEA